MNDEMVVGGLFDGFIIDFLKRAVNLDKWDREKFKQGTNLQIDSVKDIISGSWDDNLLDSMLKKLISDWVDNLGKPGPLVVGSVYAESPREFSASEVDLFLASCECDEGRKNRVRNSKRIMKVLHSTKDGAEVFTDDDRRKIVGAFPFLLLLQILGPIIIDLILKWLGK